MTATILTILAALAPVAGYWLLNYLKQRDDPTAKREAKRSEIAKAVTGGDADYVNRELDKLLNR